MGRMAIVQETTMRSTKLELLIQWLLIRSWYVGGSSLPVLAPRRWRNLLVDQLIGS
jgi:hypothetical protein